MRNLLEKLMVTAPSIEPDAEDFVKSEFFYYYVRRNDGHGTLVESTVELDLGSETCVDVCGVAQFYVVMSQYIPFDEIERTCTYKLHPNPEKAIVARDRAEARLKVQRELDARINEMDRMKRYERAAETDAIAASLLDQLLDLAA